jgi:hypothetical protein
LALFCSKISITFCHTEEKEHKEKKKQGKQESALRLDIHQPLARKGHIFEISTEYIRVPQNQAHSFAFLHATRTHIGLRMQVHNTLGIYIGFSFIRLLSSFFTTSSVIPNASKVHGSLRRIAVMAASPTISRPALKERLLICACHGRVCCQ